MSFKLFSLQLFGKIKPVNVIESERESLLNDFKEFRKVESSDELKEFTELEKWINSEAFKNRKKEIDALVFKGSQEFKQLQELETLKKSSRIKKYFKVAGSENLKRFELGKKSEKINEYENLYEYIKEGEFEKEKREIKSRVYKGSVEERHWIDFKKYDKSPGIKAFKEIHNSEILKRHQAFSASEKLKSYLKLKNAPDKDKGKLKEFKKLKKDAEIKGYFKLENSKKMKLYRSTLDSLALKRYDELKTYVESDEYKKQEALLKDKKKFEKSEAYEKLQKFKKLQADADVKFVLQFEKSALYKNYLDVKDSFDFKRYLELEDIVNSEEYKKRKAYLEDTKKWEKTEEYAGQQKYLEMKEFSHLKKYFKYKGSSAFSFFENWEVSFEDDFSAKGLDNEKWSNTGFIAGKALGENYSMPGDLHVFTGGKNVNTKGKLVLSVKKEKANGKMWKMPAGFIPADFDYTSDLVSTGKSFWQKDGIFEIKLKFNPLKQVVSSAYLSGEASTPRINLLEMGTKNSIGIASLNGSGKITNNGMDISNLKKGMWYIFTVEKSGSNIKWKINDTEVLALKNSAMDIPLHLNASSIVIHDIPGSQLPVDFEIDWVRCYQKK